MPTAYDKIFCVYPGDDWSLVTPDGKSTLHLEWKYGFKPKFYFKKVPAIQIEKGDGLERGHYVVTTPQNEQALEAWRAIPGREWDHVRKVNVIPSQSKRALWNLLQDFYAGEKVTGPKGEFTIPEESLPF